MTTEYSPVREKTLLSSLVLLQTSVYDEIALELQVLLVGSSWISSWPCRILRMPETHA